LFICNNISFNSRQKLSIQITGKHYQMA